MTGAVDPLRRLHVRGGDVSAEHLAAASRFRGLWAASGFAGGPPDATARQEVARVMAVLGRAAWPLLMHTVIEGQDVAAWCRARSEAGEKADPKRELGRLIYVLTRLTEAFDGPSAHAQRAALSRPGMPAL